MTFDAGSVYGFKPGGVYPNCTKPDVHGSRVLSQCRSHLCNSFCNSFSHIRFDCRRSLRDAVSPSQKVTSSSVDLSGVVIDIIQLVDEKQLF